MNGNPLAGLTPESAGYLAGFMVGMAMLALVILGIVKAIHTATRERGNAKCALSLALLLTGLLAIWVVTALNIQQGLPREVLEIAGCVSLGLVALSPVLAIWGLIECHVRSDDYDRGHGLAIRTMILSGLLAAIVVPNFVRARAAFLEQRAGRASGETPAGGPASSALVFDNLSFQFRAPDRPWTQMDAKKYNPEATLVFMRARPTLCFMIIGENIGTRTDANSGQLAELAKGFLRSSASSVEVVREMPARRSAITGVQIESNVRVQGFSDKPLYYVQWVGAHGGYAYQLFCWGPQIEQAAVRREAEQMFNRFEFLETPSKTASGQVATGKPSVVRARTREGYISFEPYGYAVDVADSSWQRWPSDRPEIPEADFGAVSQRGGHLAVVPVRLLGEDPPQEKLAAAFCTIAGLDPTQITQRQMVLQKHLQGAEYEASQTRDGKAYRYRFRIVKDRQVALWVAAWHAQADGDSRAIWDDVLQRVEFFPSSPSAPNLQSLSARERQRHARFFSTLAGLYAQAGQADRSEACQQLALKAR